MTYVPATGDAIRVDWEDCFSHEPWTAFSELATKSPPVMSTLGFYQGSVIGRKGDDYWMLCSGVQPDEAGEPHYGGCTWFIPATLIISWQVLA
jgi:hypothetical protein